MSHKHPHEEEEERLEHKHEHAHEREHEHEHKHDHCHDHAHHHDHGCCEGCGHCHGGEEENRKTLILRLIISAVLLALGLLLPVPEWAKIALFLLSWLAAGYNVVWNAIINILHGRALDEMFLMTVASVGAFCLGDFAEGVAVMLLYQIGEFFQDYAVDQSRDSIAELMDIRPDSAVVEREGRLVTVHPEEVKVGETILVRPGEKIPLDGIVIEGNSSLNTLALTGESVPRDVCPGDTVISGCVNVQGVLRLEATRAFGDSTVARILEMVENASENKSNADRFITRFARVYTPVVVGLAVLVALIPPLFFGGAWKEWITSALTFLVISCPCALVISVPLTFFSAIGGASKKGILIKGAGFLETLAKAGVAVFDKTGTLTKGAFTVTEIMPNGVEQDQLLSLAAAAEQYSTHPIAQALLTAWGKEPLPAEQTEEIAGRGVSAIINGKKIFAGNGKLMREAGAAFAPVEKAGTVVYVAEEGKYLGAILIADSLKENAKQAIDELNSLNVSRTVMLTGDSEAAAREAAEKLSLSEVHAELLPDGKVGEVERLMRQKGEKEALLFVGDGINDAPVLARADVGVAMGALGSDAAIEAADVVLMDDDPRKLPQAIRIARATLRIVRQNIIFSLAVKAIVMILGVMHLAPLWLAIFADVGVCFLAILNAMRAMKVNE